MSPPPPPLTLLPPLPPLALPAVALVLAACASGASTATLPPRPAAECVVATADAGDPAAASSANTTSTASVARPAGPTAGPTAGRVARPTADSATAVTVAITAPVDPAHAPWPRNDGERLLFTQLYQPLLQLDCTGTVLPGLARAWSRDSSNIPGEERWSFTLRHDAAFRDGKQLTAADVISSWRSSADAHAGQPVGRLVAAIASGARAVDDSTLVLTLWDSLASAETFASPALAIARPASGGGNWPDGTTSYYVDATRVDSTTAAHGEVARRPLAREIELRSHGVWPPLLFEIEPGADPRDVIDAGADVLITSSPAGVQYARTQDGLASIPLPWTRSYVLVLPAREHRGTGTTADCAGDDLRPLRDALAAAVHVEARGADGPCWWEAGAAARSSRDRIRVGSRQILYSIDDTTARELAERIVALAAPGRNEPAAVALRSAAPELFASEGWSASGMDSVDFAESLASASEGAYIVALPREPAWPAAARASLLAAAPWLAPLTSTHALLPLLDTRDRLLFRRGRGIPRMTILHDGTVTFDWASSASTRKASSGSTR